MFACVPHWRERVSGDEPVRSERMRVSFWLGVMRKEMCMSRGQGAYQEAEISLALLLLLWFGNKVVQVEETQAHGSPSCQRLRGLEIWEVEESNEEEAWTALSWSPWLSVEQSPSLIKEECWGDTWKWHSPPPRPHFSDAMHDGHCHSGSRVTSLSLCLFPSLFLCLRENINSTALLADMHWTPTPFIKMH